MPVVRREQSGFAFPVMARDNPMGAICFRRNNTLELIKDSVKQILMTVPGERFWNPEFGCRAKLMLFENASFTAKETIQSLVYEALTRWEPRIILSPDDVQVEESLQIATNFLVTVFYSVKDPGFDTEQQSVSVTY